MYKTKILRLLVVLAVLSLLAVFPILGTTSKGCTCSHEVCCSSHKVNCCSKSADQPVSQLCTCPSKIPVFDIGVCDTNYSYLGKSSSRASSKGHSSAGSSSSDSKNLCYDLLQSYLLNIQLVYWLS